MRTKLNFYLTKYLPRENKVFIYALEYLKEEHIFLHPLYVGFVPKTTATFIPHYITYKGNLAPYPNSCYIINVETKEL